MGLSLKLVEISILPQVSRKHRCGIRMRLRAGEFRALDSLNNFAIQIRIMTPFVHGCKVMVNRNCAVFAAPKLNWWIYVVSVK